MPRLRCCARRPRQSFLTACPCASQPMSCCGHAFPTPLHVIPPLAEIMSFGGVGSYFPCSYRFIGHLMLHACATFLYLLSPGCALSPASRSDGFPGTVLSESDSWIVFVVVPTMCLCALLGHDALLRQMSGAKASADVACHFSLLPGLQHLLFCFGKPYMSGLSSSPGKIAYSTSAITEADLF